MPIDGRKYTVWFGYFSQIPSPSSSLFRRVRVRLSAQLTGEAGLEFLLQKKAPEYRYPLYRSTGIRSNTHNQYTEILFAPFHRRDSKFRFLFAPFHRGDSNPGSDSSRPCKKPSHSLHPY